MTKWEYCEVSVEATRDHQRALVAQTFGDSRKFEGADARFPQLFRMLGNEGWEAVGLVASQFTQFKTHDDEVIDKPGITTRYLLKRPLRK